ncbi:MAG TPA: hypothetical protein VFV66_12715 [Nonomuraea sp.]|nr:hypothetical protein [Nonomuraea sp.]
MLSRLRQAAAIAIGLGLSIFASSVPAAATVPPPTAGQAYIQRDVTIEEWRYYPTTYLISLPRRIYLAADTYRWTNAFYDKSSLNMHYRAPNRDIYLATGWYKWNCWFEVPDEARPIWKRSRCYLTREATNIPAYSPSFDFQPGGQYTWRSELIRL